MRAQEGFAQSRLQCMHGLRLDLEHAAREIEQSLRVGYAVGL